jgi:SpoIIAA-like
VTDDWPLIRLVYHGDVSLEVLRAATQRSAELSERAFATGQRLSWLVDLNDFDARVLDAVKRRGAAEILAEHVPRIGPGTSAEARVVDSALIRGLLTAVTWIARQPWPIQVFATEREALGWLRTQAGMHAP